MKINTLIFLPVICLYFSPMYSNAQDSTRMSDLKTAIEQELQSQYGYFAVAYKNLATNEELMINADENFHAASTMKTPVMIEVYRQAAAGKFSLQDSIVIHNDFKSIVDSSHFKLDSLDDSYGSLYLQEGKKIPLYDLMYHMIINSSNLATNIIISLVEAKRVNGTMHEMGAGNIRVLRGVEDQKAYEAGLSNTTTARDLCIIYEKLARGQAVNKEASRQMIEILKDQKHNNIIPAGLPKGVEVAHKTGWITGVHHDSGIVFLPDGSRYVIVLLSKDLKDEAAAVAALARVSKLIYDSASGNSK